MASEIKAGAILIKEDALLPRGLKFESQPCVPGWKIVTNFDGYGLDRKIGEEGWKFFCLASEVKSGVFGIDGQKMARRSIERILKSPKLQQFNSLEIKEVVSTGSVRFPGIWHVTVSARPRHIQRGLFLFNVEDVPELDAGVSGGPDQNAGLANGETPHSEKPATKADVAQVLSS